MNLEEFVEVSLKQIIGGVTKAQEALGDIEKGGEINPHLFTQADNSPKGKYFFTTNNNLIFMVDFDVAVSAEAGRESKEGINLMVAAIGLGKQNAESSQSSSISRIKFQVPILYPKENG